MDYIVLMLSSLDGITDEPVFKQWLVIRYDLVLRRKGTTAVCCLNAVFPFAIPENPQRKCFHFLIDLGLSILLFQLMHRENRGLDRIYLILSPPPQTGTFLIRPLDMQQNKSIQDIGGPKLNIYFLLLHSSSASISSHSGLLAELLLYGPFISICLLLCLLSLLLTSHYLLSPLHLLCSLFFLLHFLSLDLVRFDK